MLVNAIRVPTVDDVLATFNLMLIMPVEYGLAVVGWGAEFNNKELNVDGTDHVRGLHTWFGAKEEREKIVANGMPYLLQSYGMLATNMIASERFDVIHVRAGHRQIY